MQKRVEEKQNDLAMQTRRWQAQSTIPAHRVRLTFIGTASIRLATFMKVSFSHSPCISAQAALLLLAAAMTSCASKDELQKRMDKRNDNYSDLQDRRRIRQDARQERTDAWYDRVLGRPSSTSSTGLTVPQ